MASGGPLRPEDLGHEPLDRERLEALRREARGEDEAPPQRGLIGRLRDWYRAYEDEVLRVHLDVQERELRRKLRASGVLTEDEDGGDTLTASPEAASATPSVATPDVRARAVEEVRRNMPFRGFVHFLRAEDEADRGVVFRALWGAKEFFPTLPLFVGWAAWDLRKRGELPLTTGAALSRASLHAISARWAPLMAIAAVFFPVELVARVLLSRAQRSRPRVPESRPAPAADAPNRVFFHESYLATSKAANSALPPSAALPAFPPATAASKALGGATLGLCIGLLRRAELKRHWPSRWAPMGVAFVGATGAWLLPSFEQMYAAEEAGFRHGSEVINRLADRGW